MRRRRSRAAVGCHLVAVAAYALLVSPARSAPANLPAVIVAPTAESRAELSRVIRGALHGVPVTLADDALTTSNVISLGHANIRDQAGRPLNGRELSRPETFELFKRGSQCVLVRSKNGHAWRLHHTRCEALPQNASRA
ncbi:MAG: hypothetical protein QOG17_495 [Gammaproteobacteria bacterium]|nr:hypothetical protein [Gammaproteobacteria bacterium]